jgi:hypothetical protein
VIGHSYAFDNPAGKDVYLARVENRDLDLYPNNSFFHEVAVELPSGQNSSDFTVWRFFNYGNLNIIRRDQQMPVGGNQCNTEIEIKRVDAMFGCLEYYYTTEQKFYIDLNGEIVTSQLQSCPDPTSKSRLMINSQKGYDSIPDELKTIIKSIRYSRGFAINNWDWDPINKSMTLYIHDISNERMLKKVEKSKVDNYTIQLVHDTEFERTRDLVSEQLTRFRENPDYHIYGISMGTDPFSNPPTYYAEVWVDELTPENKILDNTLIDGWMIQVIKFS